MSEIKLNESLLDQKLSQLEQAQKWSPRVISKLETFIRQSDDYDLFRVNPLHYASDKGLSEAESINLFLHATKLGLFEIEWLLICAFCPNVVESLPQLSSVHPHFMCQFCRAENEVALDDYIQVVFTVSPQVRDILFRHPDDLSTADYYFKYAFAKGSIPPPGLTHEQLVGMLTKALLDIPPGETKRVELDLPPGRFEISDLAHNTLLVFMIDETTLTPGQGRPLHMRAADKKYWVTSHAMHPLEWHSGPATFKFDQVGHLTPGKQVIEIDNQMNERARLWLLEYPPNFEAYFQPYEPFLSGNQLLTTQTFRDLFRSEIINPNEGLAIKDITFLFTDLKGSTAMYEQIGDTKAYFLVRQHFDTLGRVITAEGGAIVKTIGDAVMAVFDTPTKAVSAAIAMLEEIRAFNTTISQELILKIGIHRGHSIAVTLNEHIDYFGQTVNISARVQALADANEIYITGDVYQTPGVSDTLQAHHVSPEQVSVKGVSGKLQVYKIVPHQ